jgi:hypothetical protein
MWAFQSPIRGFKRSNGRRFDTFLVAREAGFSVAASRL